MFNWYEIEAKQRHREHLAEAEHSRLLRNARLGREHHASLRGRALIWVGNRLVESGKRQIGEG